MKIKKGDKVKILSGKDRGKTSTVLKVLKADNKVVVEGVNMVKRHVKPGTVSKEGGVVTIEKPVFASTVALFSDSEKKSVRVGFKVQGDKKVRISRKTNEVVDKKKASK